MKSKGESCTTFRLSRNYWMEPRLYIFLSVHNICYVCGFIKYEWKLKSYFSGLKIFKFYWDLNLATCGREKIHVCINWVQWKSFGELQADWTPWKEILYHGDKTSYLETFLSVQFSYTIQIFNTPTKCTYTIKYTYCYQYSPTYFGDYCAIFREKFCRMLKTMSQYFIPDLKIYYTWFYNIICIYLKDHIWSM